MPFWCSSAGGLQVIRILLGLTATASSDWGAPVGVVVSEFQKIIIITASVYLPSSGAVSVISSPNGPMPMAVSAATENVYV